MQNRAIQDEIDRIYFDKLSNYNVVRSYLCNNIYRGIFVGESIFNVIMMFSHF